MLFNHQLSTVVISEKLRNLRYPVNLNNNHIVVVAFIIARAESCILTSIHNPSIARFVFDYGAYAVNNIMKSEMWLITHLFLIVIAFL